MKTQYEYIHFVLALEGKKTNIWEILNNNSKVLLGTIRWYGAWRQYCLFSRNAVLNKTCLDDIKEFMAAAMEERKR